MTKKNKINKKPYILVLDPAVHTPEISTLQFISSISTFDVFYHLPAMSKIGPLADLHADTKLMRGIILLGSAANVDERLSWKNSLVKWLGRFLESGTPILGICFGHQLVASMYGAKVNYAFSSKEKYSGFRKVNLLPDELWGLKKKSGKLVVSHCQVVRNCPKDLNITAHSSEVAIEGLRHKEYPLWTFQPHPEAHFDFVEQRNIAIPASVTAFKMGHDLVKSFLNICK